MRTETEKEILKSAIEYLEENGTEGKMVVSINLSNVEDVDEIKEYLLMLKDKWRIEIT